MPASVTRKREERKAEHRTMLDALKIVRNRLAMRNALVLTAQVLALMALNEAGYAFVEFADLPLPGNLLGMLLLLALLGCRIVKLSWIDSGASLLLSHLAFFFIPIAVGLLSFADVLRHDGLSWLVTLVTAAAVGIVAAGTTTQAFSPRRRRVPEPLAQAQAQAPASNE